MAKAGPECQLLPPVSNGSFPLEGREPGLEAWGDTLYPSVTDPVSHLRL